MSPSRSQAPFTDKTPKTTASKNGSCPQPLTATPSREPATPSDEPQPQPGRSDRAAVKIYASMEGFDPITHEYGNLRTGDNRPSPSNDQPPVKKPRVTAFKHSKSSKTPAIETSRDNTNCVLDSPEPKPVSKQRRASTRDSNNVVLDTPHPKQPSTERRRKSAEYNRDDDFSESSATSDESDSGDDCLGDDDLLGDDNDLSLIVTRFLVVISTN